MKAIQEKTMRALVQDEYGAPDVLAVGEAAMPSVGDDEVLVEVHASSVNPADWHLSTGTPTSSAPRPGCAPQSRPFRARTWPGELLTWATT